MIKEKEAMDFRESKKVHKRSWGGMERGNYVILLISKIKNYHNCFKYQTARQYNLTAEPGRVVYPATSPYCAPPCPEGTNTRNVCGVCSTFLGELQILILYLP